MKSTEIKSINNVPLADVVARQRIAAIEASGGGGDGIGGIYDVQINNTSIVSDGVANIRYDSTMWASNGQAGINFPSQYMIDNRDTQPNKAVPMKLFDYAVKASLTDGKGGTWTDAEKASARTLLGIDDLIGDAIGLAQAISEVIG